MFSAGSRDGSRRTLRTRRVAIAASVALSSLATIAPASSPVSAAEPPLGDRVFYQRYSTTEWQPDNCPNDARYHTNYGCVTNGSLAAYSTVYSARPDGTDEQPIEINCGGDAPHWKAPWGSVLKVAVDAANGKLYWENDFEPGVARTNLDGSECELVAVGGYYGKKAMAIDDAGDYLYSVQHSTLRRIDVASGSVVNLTLTGLGGLTPTGYRDLTVSGDVLYATMYDGSMGYIVAIDLDTSTTAQAAHLLVAQANDISGVSVDDVNDTIYWATGAAVHRANLADGLNIITIANGSYTYVTAIPGSNSLLIGHPGTNAMVSDLYGANAVVTTLNSVSRPTTGRVPLDGEVQEVTWTPTTNLTVEQSPFTPVLATTSGDGEISYAVTSAGTTGCSVNASSAVLTFSAAGDCTVSATAADTDDFLTASTQVTFHITAADPDPDPDPENPVMELSLDLHSGDAVAGMPVTVTGSGLKPSTTVRVELHSTPIVLGQGTVDGSGDFAITVTLPAGIEAGMHQIIAFGTSANGDPIETSTDLFIDWGGEFVAGNARGYHPTAPHRVLDTRDGGVALAAGEVIAIDVTDDLVPRKAVAVAANITVTEPVGPGFVTVFPCGDQQPATSTVNYVGGQTVANMTIAGVGDDGSICAFSLVDTHLVVDVNGYFSSDGDQLTTTTPTRLVDTRDGVGLAAGDALEIDVDVDGATAAVVNVTAVDPTSAGFLTVSACDAPLPLASNANFVAGQNVPAHVFAPVVDGAICVFSSAATDLVVDLVGTFSPDAGSAFVPASPGRLWDTRDGEPLTPGADGVLELTMLPPTATAVALNVTVTEPVAAGFVTVYPCGDALPPTSNVNFGAGETVANHVTAELSGEQSVCVHTSQDAHVVVDISGLYFFEK